MTNALVTYRAPEEVRKDMDALRTQLENVLSPRIDLDRFLRVVAKTIIEDPKLMECTRLSLLASIHEAAQLGLEPSGLLGSAYLVPYNVSVEAPHPTNPAITVKRKVRVAHLIVGYRGLIDLARRSGEIDAIQADVVRLRDAFDYEPTRQPNPVIHRPYIPDPTAPIEDRDRGPVVGVYMVATLRGGFRQPEWMTTDEVEGIRKRSQAGTSGPWVTDWSEMARKTVVRRGSKYLPLTTEFRRALELDEEAEKGAEIPSLPPPPSRATQMLLDRAAEMAPQKPSEEGDGSGEGQDTIEAENGPETPPEAVVDGDPDDLPDATAICGVVNDELGLCVNPPGHRGAHRSADGVWPRK